MVPGRIPHAACSKISSARSPGSGFRTTHRTRPHLTVSVGAALFDGLEPLEQIYRRADGQLYESKAKGRNRFTLG
ncbi:diguanylate cyclase [Bosea sp. LC85]|uniref:diguanylate cyclase domain-containing protein n=1 Tax=Bosea sp. LC85 TaxID=1502851 RepID=UPI000B218828